MCGKWGRLVLLGDGDHRHNREQWEDAKEGPEGVLAVHERDKCSRSKQ